MFYAKSPFSSFFLLPLLVSCDPCDSAELLPPTTVTSNTSSSTTDLQALALASLPQLPESSCGFRTDEASYQDTLVPEQPLDLGQAFMASQMSDTMSISMAEGMQNTAGSEVANSMIDRLVYIKRCMRM